MTTLLLNEKYNNNLRSLVGKLLVPPFKNPHLLHSSRLLCPRSDSKSKEFLRQLDDERSNGQRLQDQVNQLSSKIKSLRREKEDAESEAESLMKKLKQAKAMADDAEETSNMLQAQITKLRAAARKKVCVCAYIYVCVSSPWIGLDNCQVGIGVGNESKMRLVLV